MQTEQPTGQVEIALLRDMHAHISQLQQMARGMAEELVARGVDVSAVDGSAELSRAAPRPVAQPKAAGATVNVAAGLGVVTGAIPPLSPHQRRATEIFVWYLRQLPPWQEDGWETSQYCILNQLLFAFFKANNPTWAGNQVDDLPEAECAEYTSLMQNASCGKDPRNERRLKLLELARDKSRVLRWIENYERDREELGLPLDITLPRKPATPLESAAESTWGCPA